MVDEDASRCPPVPAHSALKPIAGTAARCTAPRILSPFGQARRPKQGGTKFVSTSTEDVRASSNPVDCATPVAPAENGVTVHTSAERRGPTVSHPQPVNPNSERDPADTTPLDAARWQQLLVGHPDRGLCFVRQPWTKVWFRHWSPWTPSCTHCSQLTFRF